MNLIGPLTIQDLSKPSTTLVDGVQVTTYPPQTGLHYTTDPETFLAFPEVLGWYQVEPEKLQHVMAGDPAESPPWITGTPNPTWQTVALRFDTQAAVDAAKLAIFGPPAL